MTRNVMFSTTVIDLLQDGKRLRIQDMYPVIQRRLPEWYAGNWQHDLQNALNHLKRSGRVIAHRSPERSNRYIYRLPN